MPTQPQKLFFAGLLLLALAGCSKQPSSTADSGPDRSLEARIEKRGAEIMASNDKAEARQWMKDPNHIFFKAEAKEVAGFVEEFYRAGAAKIFIAEIEEHEGKQYGEAMLVVLPDDAAARAKLFEIGARVEVVYQDDPVKEVGQKYLYYSLD